MKEWIRVLYYKIIKKLPAKVVVNFENFRTYKRFLPKNEKDLLYFGEKIQWMKLYGNLEKYGQYVDKYEVRKYVENTIGDEYLIPLLGNYSTISEIDYNAFPKSFVLKSNNGSAMNIIVKDKANLNINKTNKKLNKWLKNKYYLIKKEYQYKNVKNQILCEKYIVDKNNELLDYKFFCFNGKVEFLKVDFDRYSNHSVNFYDTSWNLLNINEYPFKNYIGETKAPKNFDKMIDLAAKLSKPFQFVRVDLYNVDGKIYFGELTFTPASGRHQFLPLSEDKRIGEMIQLGK